MANENKCPRCGADVEAGAVFCAACGEAVPAQQTPPEGYQQPQYQQPQFDQQQYQQPQYGQPMPGFQPNAAVPPGYEQKSKMVAGLLQIFLGSVGAGRFYLGDSKKAVIQLVVTLVTCGAGSIWGLIDGIMILTGSVNVDANGVPLKD